MMQETERLPEKVSNLWAWTIYRLKVYMTILNETNKQKKIWVKKYLSFNIPNIIDILV